MTDSTTVNDTSDPSDRRARCFSAEHVTFDPTTYNPADEAGRCEPPVRRLQHTIPLAQSCEEPFCTYAEAPGLAAHRQRSHTRVEAGSRQGGARHVDPFDYSNAPADARPTT